MPDPTNQTDLSALRAVARRLWNSGPEGQAEAHHLLDAGAEIGRLRAEVERLQTERAALLGVLEPLLVEVEPARSVWQDTIDKACNKQAEWARSANATRTNDSEPWVFMREFRASLERRMERLNIAVRDANEAYDRINAGLRAGTSTSKGAFDA